MISRFSFRVLLGVLFFVSFVSWCDCGAYWLVNNTGGLITVSIKAKRKKNEVYSQGIESHNPSVYRLFVGQKCEISEETLKKIKSVYVLVGNSGFLFEKDKMMFLFEAGEDEKYNIECFQKTKRFLCFSKTCLYLRIGNEKRSVESKKYKTIKF